MAIEILLFEVSDLHLGVGSSGVHNVLRAVSLLQLPKSPAGVEGVINLRGQVVPVLDLRSLLDLPRKPMEHTDHLIVLHVEEGLVAIRVDRAVDLVRLEESDIEKTEGMLADMPYSDAIAKTVGGLIHILDPRGLLSPAATESLAQGLAAAARAPGASDGSVDVPVPTEVAQ
jgi:purine-binding chemotaxis protein CheW